MNASTKSDRMSTVIQIVPVVVWLLVYFVARGLLERNDLATWVRVAVALAPVPPFALSLWLFIRNIRSLDEMQRRIHLEALSIAFPLTMLLLMILGLLQRAVELKFEDWSYLHVWYYLPMFYFAGLAYSLRRYQ